MVYRSKILEWSLTAAICWTCINSGMADDHKLLGNFQSGPLSGFVTTQDDGELLRVQVEIDTTGKKDIVNDEIYIWVLLKNGGALSLRERTPKKGERLAKVDNAGSSTAYITFVFDFPKRNANKVVAIVLKCEDQYKVFVVNEKS
jgi:hypothetical protein